MMEKKMQGAASCKWASVINETFSGVVSVRLPNQPPQRLAFGFRDRANRIPNRVDTRFATASACKALVAVGILRLVSAGRLRMEDRIGMLLDFDLKKIDPGITVRQLLNHTSGIPDYFDESVMTEYEELWKDIPNYRIRSSRDLIPLFIDKPMGYPAGGRFAYNNTGYVVLGLVIEAVSGRPFDAFLQEDVLARSGMNGTGWFELDRLPANCADAYILDPNGEDWRTNIYSVDAKGSGAGGCFMTAEDVESFWQALMAGSLLPSELRQEMLAPQTAGSEYGYGLWLDWAGDRLQGWHFEGCDPGVSFLSVFEASNGRTVTLLSNCGDDVWSAYGRIREALDG